MFALMLGLLQVADAGRLDLPQVDRELSEIVNSHRSDLFFHSLSHYMCDNQARHEKARMLYREYRGLERRYLRLGGKFPPDEELEILLESFHTSCAKGSAINPAWEWRSAVEQAEHSLNWMRKLLARKRKLMRAAPAG